MANSVRSCLSVVLVAISALLASAACSDGAAPCDESKCAPGNKCLPLFGETKCRKTCSSNSGGGDSCPSGYTCAATQSGVPPFCVQQKAVAAGHVVVPRAKQWGTSCLASGGMKNNPACDVEQGFACYGTSPTDADAYCTRYDCTVDLECGAGFWCAKINESPNVEDATRGTIGQVRSVCLRRSYCATCQVDLDCPDVKGTKQHCIADDSGATFCAPECNGPGSCPNEAKCIDAELPPVPPAKTGPTICFPRAKVCVGDGSLCSPCRVDTDCGGDGACLKGEYTTEKACAKNVASCKACPASVASPKRQVGCSSKPTSGLPANYCFGVYSIGGVAGADVGCWTLDR